MKSSDDCVRLKTISIDQFFEAASWLRYEHAQEKQHLYETYLHRRKKSIPFFVWLVLFLDKDRTFVEIAAVLDVSENVVGQTYRKYFESILPETFRGIERMRRYHQRIARGE